MQRYFISESGWYENKVHITDEEAHHITSVMRKKPGDVVICVHPDGSAATCRIEHVSHEDVTAHIMNWLEETTESPVNITIVQGLPKGDKIELTLKKGTELGATEFIPFEAERSIVSWDHKKKEKKRERFAKIVQEASEQSHRNKIPDVQPVMSMTEAIKHVSGYDWKIVAYEDEAKSNDFHSLAEILKQIHPREKIAVCIGPEGGLSESEVTLLKQHHFSFVRLGPRILRTETAALYVLASISYHVEEWWSHGKSEF